MSIVYIVVTAAWFVFMTFLSHQKGERTGTLSRTIAERLLVRRKGDSDRLGIVNGRLRAGAHVVVYLVLTILLLYRAPWWTVFLVCVWAWADEATKPLVQGRHFSWRDVGLNILGIAIGAGIMFVAFSIVS